MSLHYISPDILKNYWHRHFTDNNWITVILNFPTKKIFTYFQYFRKICQRTQSKRRIFEGFCVCFKSCIWKTLVESDHVFLMLKKKDLGLTFFAKNVQTLLKRIDNTFKSLALQEEWLTDIFQYWSKSFRYSFASKNSENPSHSNT